MKLGMIYTLLMTGIFCCCSCLTWCKSRTCSLNKTLKIKRSIKSPIIYQSKIITVSGADQQPTLDTVGTDEMRLHSRGNCGWISCISLLACLSLLLLGGGIFEHLYFRSTDLQNSNAIVQNDFLATEQKSLITPPQPTSPTYWKINIRLWAG